VLRQTAVSRGIFCVCGRLCQRPIVIRLLGLDVAGLAEPGKPSRLKVSPGVNTPGYIASRLKLKDSGRWY
jgi:hypothetical protein